MKKNVFNWFLSVAGYLFIIVVIGSYVIVAQNAVKGEWKAETGENNDGKIHLSFERKTSSGLNQNGSSFNYDQLRGLTQDQTKSGAVKFQLVREAGTIECEGSFVDGKGSGTFRFMPDPNFLAAMRSRGFDFERSVKNNGSLDDKMLSAALVNVTTAIADDIRSADLGDLDVDDLFKAAIFKIDSKYIAEMKTAGFPNLQMEDLVKAKIFKIDADFVREVQQMGFAKNDFENLVKFRIFKVTPEFLAELKNEGFTNLSAEDIVKFRIFKIDTDFIRRAKMSEPNITVEEMVQMKIGVLRSKGSI